MKQIKAAINMQAVTKSYIAADYFFSYSYHLCLNTAANSINKGE